MCQNYLAAATTPLRQNAHHEQPRAFLRLNDERSALTRRSKRRRMSSSEEGDQQQGSAGKYRRDVENAVSPPPPPRFGSMYVVFRDATMRSERKRCMKEERMRRCFRPNNDVPKNSFFSVPLDMMFKPTTSPPPRCLGKVKSAIRSGNDKGFYGVTDIFSRPGPVNLGFLVSAD